MQSQVVPGIVFVEPANRPKVIITAACDRAQASVARRDDAIMVLVTVPGERWEIEFLGDGSVEVERFLSNGEICGEEVLHELLSKYADPEHADAM